MINSYSVSMKKTDTIRSSIFLFFCLFFTLCSVHAQMSYKSRIDSAKHCFEKMNFQRALFHYEDALKLSKKCKDNKRIISDLLAIGSTYSDLDEYGKSFENRIKALKLAEKLEGEDSLKFEALLNLTDLSLKRENPDGAKKYLDRVKVIAEQIAHPYYLHQYYNHLGILERYKKNFDASINAYKRAIEITTNGEFQIKYLNNIATAYAVNKKYEKEIFYLLKAKKRNETVQDEYSEMVLCGQLGFVYRFMERHSEAEYYLKIALDKAIKSDNKLITKRAQRELARLYYKLGDYKEAYNFYSDFVKELESSHERENSRAIAEMTAKYEHEKKEQKIATLEQEKKLKDKIHQSQTERKKLWLALAVIVAALTMIIAIVVFKNQRNKQRLKLELTDKQKELAKQEAELKGQEIERNRLSRELHDGLGGTLSSIKIRLSSKNIQELDPILKDIDAACIDIRNMSHSLNSSIIEDMNFSSLLLKLCGDIKTRSLLKVNLELMPVDKLNDLESERRHQCYRIIQDAYKQCGKTCTSEFANHWFNGE